MDRSCGTDYRDIKCKGFVSSLQIVFYGIQPRFYFVFVLINWVL